MMWVQIVGGRWDGKHVQIEDNAIGLPIMIPVPLPIVAFVAETDNVNPAYQTMVFEYRGNRDVHGHPMFDYQYTETRP